MRSVPRRSGQRGGVPEGVDRRETPRRGLGANGRVLTVSVLALLAALNAHGVWELPLGGVGIPPWAFAAVFAIVAVLVSHLAGSTGSRAPDRTRAPGHPQLRLHGHVDGVLGTPLELSADGRAGGRRSGHQPARRAESRLAARRPLRVDRRSTGPCSGSASSSPRSACSSSSRRRSPFRTFQPGRGSGGCTTGGSRCACAGWRAIRTSTPSTSHSPSSSGSPRRSIRFRYLGSASS